MIDEKERKRLETETTMREAHDLRVLVVGGGFQYIQMFFDAGLKGAHTVDEADLICFTGGEDVDPQLYGEKALPVTNYNPDRDAREMDIFKKALAKGKPMVGICRGAQFLNVMQPGGKLWQDVNNHAIGHTHSIVDLKTGDERAGMTSTHHQQMIEGDDAEVLALAKLSTKKTGAKKKVDRKTPKLDDAEVIWYPNTLSLCFQPHPEFRHGECRNYFLELLDEYVIPAC